MPAVIPTHEEGPALLEHPEAEHCLEGVVDNHHPPYLIRLPVLHEFGASNLQCELSQVWVWINASSFLYLTLTRYT